MNSPARPKGMKTSWVLPHKELLICAASPDFINAATNASLEFGIAARELFQMRPA